MIREKIKYWWLKRIFAKEVKQSHWHMQKLINLYKLINNAASNEFVEDTKPSLDSFLRECFEKSLKEKSNVI
jgi:hypothetical protein